jgi:hypothetical protein
MEFMNNVQGGIVNSTHLDDESQENILRLLQNILSKMK